MLVSSWTRACEKYSRVASSAPCASFCKTDSGLPSRPQQLHLRGSHRSGDRRCSSRSCGSCRLSLCTTRAMVSFPVQASKPAYQPPSRILLVSKAIRRSYMMQEAFAEVVKAAAWRVVGAPTPLGEGDLQQVQNAIGRPPNCVNQLSSSDWVVSWARPLVCRTLLRSDKKARTSARASSGLVKTSGWPFGIHSRSLRTSNLQPRREQRRCLHACVRHPCRGRFRYGDSPPRVLFWYRTSWWGVLVLTGLTRTDSRCSCC